MFHLQGEEPNTIFKANVLKYNINISYAVKCDVMYTWNARKSSDTTSVSRILIWGLYSELGRLYPAVGMYTAYTVRLKTHLFMHEWYLAFRNVLSAVVFRKQHMHIPE